MWNLSFLGKCLIIHATVTTRRFTVYRNYTRDSRYRVRSSKPEPSTVTSAIFVVRCIVYRGNKPSIGCGKGGNGISGTTVSSVMRMESYPSKGNFLFMRKSASIDRDQFPQGKPITGGESIVKAVVFWTNKQETSLARRRDQQVAAGNNPPRARTFIQFSDLCAFPTAISPRGSNLWRTTTSWWTIGRRLEVSSAKERGRGNWKKGKKGGGGERERKKKKCIDAGTAVRIIEKIMTRDRCSAATISARTLRASNYAIIQIAICVPRLFLVSTQMRASERASPKSPFRPATRNAREKSLAISESTTRPVLDITVCRE